MNPFRVGAVTALVALAVASTAGAATVTLAADPTASQVVALPMKGGGVAHLAPSSSYVRFIATLANDAGAPIAPVPGAYPTVDLIARTPEGDQVVSTQTVFNGTPITFPLQYLQQNTTYYARLNPAPASGVAAAAVSNPLAYNAFLRHFTTVSRNSVTRKVTFSGFFSDAQGVDESKAMRVMVQRRKGSKWVTLAVAAPNRLRSWKKIVPLGATPAVFRVRTIPQKPARYVKVTELRYCVARTKAAAAKLCKSVPLDLG